MADKEKKTANSEQKKTKSNQTDKYYKIKADFAYLLSYNYRITKEIGRGGYGVVYKVLLSLCRQSTHHQAANSSSQSR